jgi:hypothetical protein
MFLWQKELDRLAVPGRKVLRLQQSFNRIQVALPGLPSQEATAYLCAFGSGTGARVAAVLHLHASGRMAVYLNDEGEVGERKVGSVFNEGISFVESMGFMLDDLHVQGMSNEERETLWNTLPLAELEQPLRQTVGSVVVGAPSVKTVESAGLLQSEMSEEQKWMPPSLRRRLRPSSKKIEERRVKFCENLGRFLASM